LDVVVARNDGHDQRLDALFVTHRRVGGFGLLHATHGEYGFDFLGPFGIPIDRPQQRRASNVDRASEKKETRKACTRT